MVIGTVENADDRNLRQKLAAHDIDVVPGGKFGKFSRDHTEIVVRSEAERLFARGWQHRALARQHEPSRWVANGTNIFGSAYLQRTLLGDKGSLSLRKGGLGLCHVGASNLAYTETVLGRFELLAQDLDVVAVNLD